MRIFFALFVLAISNLASAGCLDISGTFLMNYFGGSPKCAHGIRVERSWYKYQQTECSQVAIAKVYKLADNTSCEGPANVELADGAEHSSGGYTYKYEILKDRHIFTLRNDTTGITSTVVKTLDSEGNLVVDGSDGHHEVLQRTEIK